MSENKRRNRMKKIIFGVAMLLMFANYAKAETIVVIDDNGYVKQQIVTSNPSGYVSATPSQLTVVRENPVVNNAYYYDSVSTEGAVLAGLTTAVVGSLLWDEFKHDKHHRYKPAPIRVGKGHHKRIDGIKHKFGNNHKPHGKK